jgi:hypothetical protein
VIKTTEAATTPKVVADMLHPTMDSLQAECSTNASRALRRRLLQPRRAAPPAYFGAARLMIRA